MKYGPITDERLADALKHHGAEDIDIVRMAEELTARRARDLTPAEREALEWARTVLATSGMFEHQQHDPTVREHVEKCEAARTAISKLLAADGVG
jgi:hypothetical protein